MLTVQPIPTKEARPWILNRHYAHRMPSVSYAFGLFDGLDCVGVVTYGLPASPHLCQGLCGPGYANVVVELNRLCVNSTGHNASGVLVSGSLRLLPDPLIVVSFADTRMGHVGTVYQATNWLYLGQTDAGRKTPRPDRIGDRDLHGRHACRIQGTDKVDVELGTLVPRAPKHRYVYFVGNKRQRRDIRRALKYPVLPYPKGETKRYDASAEMPTQMLLFQGNMT